MGKSDRNGHQHPHHRPFARSAPRWRWILLSRQALGWARAPLTRAGLESTAAAVVVETCAVKNRRRAGGKATVHSRCDREYRLRFSQWSQEALWRPWSRLPSTPPLRHGRCQRRSKPRPGRRRQPSRPQRSWLRRLPCVRPANLVDGAAASQKTEDAVAEDAAATQRVADEDRAIAATREPFDVTV